MSPVVFESTAGETPTLPVASAQFFTSEGRINRNFERNYRGIAGICDISSENILIIPDLKFLQL